MTKSVSGVSDPGFIRDLGSILTVLLRAFILTIWSTIPNGRYVQFGSRKPTASTPQVSSSTRICGSPSTFVAGASTTSSTSSLPASCCPFSPSSPSGFRPLPVRRSVWGCQFFWRFRCLCCLLRRKCQPHLNQCLLLVRNFNFFTHHRIDVYRSI